ncbi:MAG TPA: hypothetical protein VI542_32365 [Candidatus Tectomicrobia bacterium]
MATIVCVHGIAQQQYGADVLENQWLPALASGVRTAGFDALADRLWRDRASPDGIEARMAFYGHLLLRPDQQGDTPDDLTPEEARLAEKLGEEWLTRGAVRSSNVRVKQAAARELAYLRGQVGAQEQGIRALARSGLSSVARLPWFARVGMAFAERFVYRALKQVTCYLTDDAVRAAALATVAAHVDAETQIVIGHSLGSVIAYEAAHQLMHPLPLLLTLGSPLGLNTIIVQHLHPQPPGFPPLVRRWVNVADREDLIAAEPDLASLFSQGLPTTALFESGYTVDNGAEPHRADFYLTKAVVGKPVGETLSAR